MTPNRDASGDPGIDPRGMPRRAVFAIRHVSAWKNETLLFIITGLAIILRAARSMVEISGPSTPPPKGQP